MSLQFHKPETMAADQVKALIATMQGGSSPRTSKYNNVTTYVGDLKFDSGMEADRWGELTLLWQHGRIHFLERQVKFEFVVNGVSVGSYRADYCYLEDGWYIVEDKKGAKDTAYKLRRRLMLACHGITIRET